MYFFIARKAFFIIILQGEVPLYPSGAASQRLQQETERGGERATRARFSPLVISAAVKGSLEGQTILTTPTHKRSRGQRNVTPEKATQRTPPGQDGP